MRPCVPGDGVPHCRAVDAKAATKSIRSQCPAMWAIEAPDKAHRFVIQAGAPASLGVHVDHIVGAGAQKQVRRLDAGRIVTVMAYEHAVRDGTKGDLPSHAVCPTWTPLEHELPIVAPACASACCPLPTSLFV